MGDESTASRRILAFRVMPFHRDEGWRPLVPVFAGFFLLISVSLFLIIQSDEPGEALRELGLPVGGLLLLSGVLFAAVPFLRKHVRLILDEDGIHHRNTLPLLTALRPSWDLPWEAITRVEYRGRFRSDTEAKGLRQVVLHPQAGKVRKLDPAQWMDTDPNAEDFGLRMRDVRFVMSQYTMQRKRQQMALDSPLVAELVRRGWPVRRPGTEALPGSTPDTPGNSVAAPPQEKPFDLTTHPRLMALVGAMLGLLIYFLLDTFVLSPWRYASDAPLAAFISSGVLASLAGMLVATGAPRRERLVVGVMFGAALGAALWPAALRVNAAFPGGPPQAITYQAMSPGYYQAVEGDYPDMVFDEIPAYWAHPRQLGEKTFYLLRGDLGFWQFDNQRIIEDMQAFFAEQEEAPK